MRVGTRDKAKKSLTIGKSYNRASVPALEQESEEGGHGAGHAPVVFKSDRVSVLDHFHRRRTQRLNKPEGLVTGFVCVWTWGPHEPSVGLLLLRPGSSRSL